MIMIINKDRFIEPSRCAGRGGKWLTHESSFHPHDKSGRQALLLSPFCRRRSRGTRITYQIHTSRRGGGWEAYLRASSVFPPPQLQTRELPTPRTTPRGTTCRGPAKRSVMPDAECKALPLLGFDSGGLSQTFQECLVDLRTPPSPTEWSEHGVSVLCHSNNHLVSRKLPRSSEQSSRMSTSSHVHPMSAGDPLSMHEVQR